MVLFAKRLANLHFSVFEYRLVLSEVRGKIHKFIYEIKPLSVRAIFKVVLSGEKAEITK